MGHMPSPAPDAHDKEHSYLPQGTGMIAGIGIDIADIDRLADRLAKNEKLRERLFAPEERGLSIASLAARVAAKEAVGKALGNPGELSWHDVIVRKTADHRPYVVLRGASLATARARGITNFHLSLSHDGRLATAMVVAERGVQEGADVGQSDVGPHTFLVEGPLA